MKTTLLILVMVFCANIAGYAQNDTIYLRFTAIDISGDGVISPDVNSGGRVYKYVPPIGEVEEEPSIIFSVRGDMNGFYRIRLSHYRFNASAIGKYRPFEPDNDFMEVTYKKADSIDEKIIDLDQLMMTWTQADAWKFVDRLENAKRIYVIDTRDTEGSHYLMRKVKFSNSNHPGFPLIIAD